MDLSAFLPALPEIFLACWAMFLLVFATGEKEGAAYKTAGLTVLGLGIAFVLQFQPHVLGGQLAGLGINAFNQFTGSLVLIVAALAALLAGDYLTRYKRHLGEFYVLMILSVLGMRLMMAADNLLMLYLGLEMMSFALYILCAFVRDDAKGAESALKYFVLGSLASGFLLYGASLLYGITGSLDFNTIAQSIYFAEGDANLFIIRIAMIFMLVALLFKISVIPFHMWTPDVYQGAPTPVTAFMATAPKIAGVAILLKVLHGPLSAVIGDAHMVIAILAGVTMLAGSLLAIVQDDIKRLLAYSSIAQVGFILLGVIANSEKGIAGVLFYLAVYAFTTLGLFAILLQLRNRQVFVTKVSDLQGLGKSEPTLAMLFMLCLFSLSGVPPLAGFFAKLYVFQAAVNAGYVWLVVSAGAVGSAIAVYYSLKVLKSIYFVEGKSRWEIARPASLKWVALMGAFATVVFFIMPQPLWVLASKAAYALF